jgi:hypothetical protein
MKKMITVLALLATISVAHAEPRVVLTENQAKSIALIQVRILNVNDDILSIIQNDIEPVYQIASIIHLGYDVYKVEVRRVQPGQTCQQSLIINDSTGSLDDKSNAKCE